MSGLVVHEWVEQSGGSEKVVDEMLAAVPDSDVRVLWLDDAGRFPNPVTESWLARTPLRNHKSLSVPVLPFAWRNLRIRPGIEWMLVSSHLFAHHATIAGNLHIPKLVYTHTPARYIWAPDLDPRGRSLPARLASAALKPIDRRRAQEAEAIAANSDFTRERVERAWQREASVIYPPVDVERIQQEESWTDRLGDQDRALLDSLPTPFILGASRFVSYKRLDLVIRTAEAARLPVVLAGRGPERDALADLASVSSVPVSIIDSPSDELLFALYESALAFVFPAVEDFGIMPVEAMATGAGVICGTTGGATESVIHGETGAHIPDWDDARSLAAAVERASGVDRGSVRAHADKFSRSAFRANLRSWMTDHVDIGGEL